MGVSREEAARLALDVANRLWGYPTADDVLVICDEWAEESDAAWAFTYNTRTYALTGDLMRALPPGDGPIVVAKATGKVCVMPSAYGCREALLVWQMGHMIPKAYIVYCHGRTVLDRREYPDPPVQEMQREYPDYKTSLGPWSEAEIVDFFTVDYRRDESRWPISRQDIADFFRSGQPVLERRWAEPGAAPDPGRR